GSGVCGRGAAVISWVSAGGLSSHEPGPAACFRPTRTAHKFTSGSAAGEVGDAHPSRQGNRPEHAGKGRIRVLLGQIRFENRNRRRSLQSRGDGTGGRRTGPVARVVPRPAGNLAAPDGNTSGGSVHHRRGKRKHRAAQATACV